MKLTSYRFFKSVNFFQAILQSRGLTANHSESFQLYKRNECVSVDNNGMNRIFFVAKGKVKLFQSLPNGRELVKAIVLPGQLFTEDSICEESRKTDYARVMDEDTAILCIQYRPVQ